MDAYRGIVPQAGMIEIEGFTLPEPAVDEIVIRTHKTLISPGTERAFFLGLPNTTRKFPMTMGYNLVGEVIQAGRAVTAFQIGDLVTCQGQHASHVVVPAERCHLVPADLAEDEAVFCQLVTIVLQGVRKTGVEIGEAAAIIGAGPIGLLALQVMRNTGAMPMVVIDKEPRRLDLPLHLGADFALLADDDLIPSLNAALGAEGAPVVIEVTGSPEAVPLAFQVAALRGRVVLLGSTRGETEPVNFYRDVHKKGLTIVGAHVDTTRMVTSNSPQWWPMREEQRLALKLLRLGRVQGAPLVSHRFAGEQLTDAYELLASWDPGVMAMLIDWR